MLTLLTMYIFIAIIIIVGLISFALGVSGGTHKDLKPSLYAFAIAAGIFWPVFCGWQVYQFKKG